jgi:hypothetical protein
MRKRIVRGRGLAPSRLQKAFVRFVSFCPLSGYILGRGVAATLEAGLAPRPSRAYNCRYENFPQTALIVHPSLANRRLGYCCRAG